MFCDAHAHCWRWGCIAAGLFTQHISAGTEEHASGTRAAKRGGAGLHGTIAHTDKHSGVWWNLADEHWPGIILHAHAVKLDDVAIVVQPYAKTCSISLQSLQNPSMRNEVDTTTETLCLYETCLKGTVASASSRQC